jgi:hypothetical protein
MVWVYGALIALEVGMVVIGKKKLRAFGDFRKAWKGNR